MGIDIFPPHWLEIVVKIFLAAFVGAVIGFEREKHGQAAGFRTNTLVCLSACLLMLLSVHIAQMYAHLSSDSVVRIDPGRIASYAIAGMGFLGAGAIIKGKGAVRGLTTAASLWMVTALGLAIGAGFIFPALIALGVSLPVLYSLNFFKFTVCHDEYTILIISCSNKESDPLPALRATLNKYPDIRILFVNFKEDVQLKQTEYRLRLLSTDCVPWGHVFRELRQLPMVLSIGWQESDVP
ncbi:MgtC/SapB family protein [Desulfohalobium retbaense]|uniref:MgtC/SapB transporter n=1 Tax=Desulfohalobium retbaense (strain ATCC 49708 / DSM 5692 / JCM 16813 / HR100) TaxID=485915 RepID=C8X2J6_DESRD|nr:MgtC/SapB family protein [Desulfohalobium retbaense]ACV68643.1 MgtC/SapB transporter [Desulfohalobium retbaense DSM 5692]